MDTAVTKHIFSSYFLVGEERQTIRHSTNIISDINRLYQRQKSVSFKRDSGWELGERMRALLDQGRPLLEVMVELSPKC